MSTRYGKAILAFPLAIAGLLADAQGALGSTRCLTASPPAPGVAAVARPSVLFMASEQRRSLSGSRMVLVRGEVPEPGVEALAAVVEAGYRRIAGELGFVGFPDRIALSFADLPDGVGGYLLPSTRLSAADIVLNRRLERGALERALAHELGHVASAAYAVSDASWWAEATAEWISGKLDITGDAAGRAVGSRWARPDGSLFRDRVPAAEAWPAFLAARFGDEVVRQIWEQAAAEPGTGLRRAMESVLLRRGSSLQMESEAFAAWLVAEARRRGAGEVLAEATDASRIYPVEGHAASRGSEPFGVSFLRFGLDEIAGGLQIQIVADAGAEWSAIAVLVPLGGLVPTSRVSFARDGEGRATLALPSGVFGEAIVAVIHLGGSERLGYRFRATVDERFPFELIELDAEAQDGGEVLVRWATASEADVLGWSVLRRDAQGGSFHPLHSMLVPGAEAAGSHAGAEYSFVDREVSSGRVYDYLLEAMTSDGLPAHSQVVSVRTSN